MSFVKNHSCSWKMYSYNAIIYYDIKYKKIYRIFIKIIAINMSSLSWCYIIQIQSAKSLLSGKLNLFVAWDLRSKCLYELSKQIETLRNTEDARKPLTPRNGTDQLMTGWRFPSLYFESSPISFFSIFCLFSSVVIFSISRFCSLSLANISQFSVLEFFASSQSLSLSRSFSCFWSPPNSPVFGTLRSGHRRCRAPL